MVGDPPMGLPLEGWLCFQWFACLSQRAELEETHGDEAAPSCPAQAPASPANCGGSFQRGGV